MVWLTSQGVDRCEGCVESCSIFFFCLKIDGAIFGAMVGCAAMIHVAWRFQSVRASAAPSAMIQCSASLTTSHGSLVEGSLISFLRRCSEILLPILWWPATIRINDVHLFGVASLVFIVARSWGFVGF
jgi:hypothetical protein